MSLRTWVAENWRTAVTLNLPELNALLNAAIEAGAGDRREPDLTRAALRVERARDKRLRAVERAAA